jgi:hypothetical protein
MVISSMPIYMLGKVLMVHDLKKTNNLLNVRFKDLMVASIPDDGGSMHL